MMTLPVNFLVVVIIIYINHLKSICNINHWIPELIKKYQRKGLVHLIISLIWLRYGSFQGLLAWNINFYALNSSKYVRDIPNDLHMNSTYTSKKKYYIFPVVIDVEKYNIVLPSVVLLLWCHSFNFVVNLLLWWLRFTLNIHVNVCCSFYFILYVCLRKRIYPTFCVQPM